MTIPANNLKLATRLGDTLLRAGLKVATAESCTGGGVAQAITAVAGSSGWFEYGAVTYSNAMKTKALGVPATLLNAQGAVSEPVVEAMVAGLLGYCGADLGVAISGIAGPDGGVAGKPVGTVCFGWGRKDSIHSCTVRFEGGREAVRDQSVAYALTLLIRLGEGKTTV